MKAAIRGSLAWVGTAVALVLIAGLLWLWRHPLWAPAVVRRTPAGTTLVYLNLAPLRATHWLSRLPPAAATGSGYAAFVAATGFHFERDLDALACSLDGPPLNPTRTTCILQGRFGRGFTTYLDKHATRRQAAGDRTAYFFPGWSHPDQAMWVVELGGGYVLASNAPPASAGSLIRWASSSWHHSPALWTQPRTGVVVAVLGIDAERLAADGQLDGSAPPWRGAQRLRAVVSGDPVNGLSLDGAAPMATSADAAAANAWAHDMVAGVGAVLPPPKGQVTLATLLDNLELEQNGNEFDFRLHLAPAVLTAMLASSHARN